MQSPDCDPSNAVAQQNARGEMIVVNKLAGAIQFFTLDGSNKLGELSMPKFPHEVVITPDGTTACVSIYGHGVFNKNSENPGREVVLIDLATRSIKASMDVSPYRAPHGMVFDGHGLLWVSCDLSGVVIALDLSERKIVAVVKTESFGTHWLAVTPDGRKIYASNKHFPFAAVIDTEARTLARKIPLEQGSEGLAMSPDGSRLFVMAQRPQQIYVIDTASDTVVDVVPLSGLTPTPADRNPQKRVKVAPDGRHLLMTSFNTGQIVIAPTANLTDQATLEVEKGPMGITFSGPDRAYVMNHDQGSISMVDINARRVIGRFETLPGPETLALF